jgi:hypothetical protein
METILSEPFSAWEIVATMKTKKSEQRSKLQNLLQFHHVRPRKRWENFQNSFNKMINNWVNWLEIYKNLMNSRMNWHIDNTRMSLMRFNRNWSYARKSNEKSQTRLSFTNKTK